MYESGVDNAVIEVTDTENKVHKITSKKGGVLNLGREDKTLYLAWDDSDKDTYRFGDADEAEIREIFLWECAGFVFRVP